MEEHYCFECYQQLSFPSSKKRNACPYCDTTAEEFQATKLVGCAYCYQTLKDVVYPVMQKMQGKKTHKGKFPTLETENDEETLGATFENATEEEILNTRIERQGRELSLIIKKLKAEGKYEQAKDYADKFSRMKSQNKIEEDFVCRSRSET